jgi:hypothetical protein
VGVNHFLDDEKNRAFALRFTENLYARLMKSNE